MTEPAPFKQGDKDSKCLGGLNFIDLKKILALFQALIFC